LTKFEAGKDWAKVTVAAETKAKIKNLGPKKTHGQYGLTGKSEQKKTRRGRTQPIKPQERPGQAKGAKAQEERGLKTGKGLNDVQGHSKKS